MNNYMKLNPKELKAMDLCRYLSALTEQRKIDWIKQDNGHYQTEVQLEYATLKYNYVLIVESWIMGRPCSLKPSDQPLTYYMVIKTRSSLGAVKTSISTENQIIELSIAPNDFDLQIDGLIITPIIKLYELAKKYGDVSINALDEFIEALQ